MHKRRCLVCHEWKNPLEKALSSMSRKDREENKHHCPGKCASFESCPSSYVDGHADAKAAIKQEKQERQEKKLLELKKKNEEKAAKQQKQQEAKERKELQKKRKLGTDFNFVLNVNKLQEMRASASEHWENFKKANNIKDNAAGPDALQSVVSGLRKCFQEELGAPSVQNITSTGMLQPHLWFCYNAIHLFVLTRRSCQS